MAKPYHHRVTELKDRHGWTSDTQAFGTLVQSYDIVVALEIQHFQDQLDTIETNISRGDYGVAEANWRVANFQCGIINKLLVNMDMATSDYDQLPQVHNSNRFKKWVKRYCRRFNSLEAKLGTQERAINTYSKEVKNGK